MTKKYFSRITAMLLAVFVAFGMICFNTGEVNAKSSWYVALPDTMYVGMEGYSVDVGKYNESTGETTWAKKIISVKSSNKSVLKVKTEKWDNNKYFNLKCKKAGKAKLTVKYKKPDGSTSTVKKTIKVKKYPNQIKSLKVNGKKVKVSENKYQYFKSNNKKSSVKIKMALKKGWKISYVSVRAYNSKTDKSKDIKVSKSAVKNGKAIKIPKSYTGLDINIGMEKGNDYISYYIGVEK